MIRGTRLGSVFVRNATASGLRGRRSATCLRSTSPAPAIKMGLGVVKGSTNAGVTMTRRRIGLYWQSRCMSATPGSLDEKKNEPVSEGFLQRVMGKESCVVSLHPLLGISPFIRCLYIPLSSSFAFAVPGRKRENVPSSAKVAVAVLHSRQACFYLVAAVLYSILAPEQHLKQEKSSLLAM